VGSSSEESEKSLGLNLNYLPFFLVEDCQTFGFDFSELDLPSVGVCILGFERCKLAPVFAEMLPYRRENPQFHSYLSYC
jgi:hypothetical protein